MKLDQRINKINNSRKTLWILCGLPYSGKTYLCKRIIKETENAYISIDNILEKLGFDWDTRRLPDEAGWKKVFDLSYEQTKEALKNNLSVLYDSTNHTKASRDVLRKIAKEVGAETGVIFVDVPTQIIWKRWEENALQKHRSIVAKELVEQTIQSFEKPADEGEVLRFQDI